jgi:hypothetical protein
MFDTRNAPPANTRSRVIGPADRHRAGATA